MEHQQHQDAEDTGIDLDLVFEALGITDDMSVEEAPEWVRKELTPAQRRAFSQLVVHVATRGMGHPAIHSMVLLKLALQPGLPAQASGLLAFVAAEFMAAILHDERNAGRATINTASALGLIDQASRMLRQAHTPEDEEQDQDAGNALGVGA